MIISASFAGEGSSIPGCTDNLACNYDSNATEDDGSCAFCYTEYGDSICNAYNNSGNYWDWYVNLFDCEVDHQVDSTFLVEVGCDLRIILRRVPGHIILNNPTL